MNNIFGISFSNTTLNIAHSIREQGRTELISVKSIEYPFLFSYDTLFSDDNLNQTAKMISLNRQEEKIDQAELYISLPVNFTYPKRVALPVDADAELTGAQVKWELSNYLQGELADYKVIKKDSELVCETYKEALFIAGKKDTLERLNKLALVSDCELNGMKQDIDSILSYLEHFHSAGLQGNQIVFVADKFTLSAHVYLMGKYYQTYIDEINGRTDDTAELCLNRYRQIEKTLDQLPLTGDQECKIYLAGPSVDLSILDILNDKTAKEIIHLKISEKTFESFAVEALGLTL